ncbi:transposase [Streptomyces lasiicapitis]|uniref:transposase n=1 Tax=Streptomyces lasiicapitis TaxID=1923961 RepID=UPI00366573F9
MQQQEWLISGASTGLGRTFTQAAGGLSVDITPVREQHKPCTAVTDNASAHTANAFKGRRRQLAKIGAELRYLSPHSPELNDIERVWRRAKYEDRQTTSPKPLSRARGVCPTSLARRIYATVHPP